MTDTTTITSEVPASTREGSPTIGSFEYHVLVQVYLPIQHADLLRERAVHHYDWRVRDCGTHGAINGLRNIALWTSEREPGEDPPLPHALTDDDIQTALKAMEQRIPGEDEVWDVLRDALAAVNRRWCELSGVEP